MNYPVLPEIHRYTHPLSSPRTLHTFRGGVSVAVPRRGPLRCDRNVRTVRQRLGRVGPADIDVMGAAVDTVYDQVVAVVDLVGETARDDAADELLRVHVGDRKSTRLNSSH